MAVKSGIEGCPIFNLPEDSKQNTFGFHGLITQLQDVFESKQLQCIIMKDEGMVPISLINLFIYLLTFL